MYVWLLFCTATYQFLTWNQIAGYGGSLSKISLFRQYFQPKVDFFFNLIILIQRSSNACLMSFLHCNDIVIWILRLRLLCRNFFVQTILWSESEVKILIFINWRSSYVCQNYFFRHSFNRFISFGKIAPSWRQTNADKHGARS